MCLSCTLTRVFAQKIWSHGSFSVPTLSFSIITSSLTTASFGVNTSSIQLSMYVICIAIWRHNAASFALLFMGFRCANNEGNIAITVCYSWNAFLETCNKFSASIQCFRQCMPDFSNASLIPSPHSFCFVVGVTNNWHASMPAGCGQ